MTMETRSVAPMSVHNKSVSGRTAISREGTMGADKENGGHPKDPKKDGVCHWAVVGHPGVVVRSCHYEVMLGKRVMHPVYWPGSGGGLEG